MIFAALDFLKKQIQGYLDQLPDNNATQDKIHLSPLVDENGKTILENIGLTLVNIEEEKLLRNQKSFEPTSTGSFIKVNPEINLNLFFLITANFGTTEDNYIVALKRLTSIATYFQNHLVFSHKNSPSLDKGIDHLTIEMVNLSFEAQNNLWASLGAKYLPSILYKLRMVTLLEKEALSEAPPITEANLIV